MMRDSFQKSVNFLQLESNITRTNNVIENRWWTWPDILQEKSAVGWQAVVLLIRDANPNTKAHRKGLEAEDWEDSISPEFIS